MRRRRRDDAADEQQQEQWPRHWCRSRHHHNDRHTPAQGQQGQRQAQAPEARCENAASRATGLRIVDNAPCTPGQQQEQLRKTTIRTTIETTQRDTTRNKRNNNTP